MHYLGIDISKQTLDCCHMTGGFFYARKYRNDERGYKELAEYLSEYPKDEVRICCEATGRYYEAMAEYLHGLGYHIAVENPRKIKGFGVAVLQRSKTDKQDAELIARYCKAVEPRAWQPLAAEQKELRELVRYIGRLKRQRAAEKVKLAESSEAVRNSILNILAVIDSEIRNMRQALREFYRKRETLKEESRRLQTIKGVGEYAAAAIQTVLHDGHGFETAAQFVAYLGLDPKQHQSGTSVRGRSRISKVGSSEMRAALYMPAVVAYSRGGFPRLVRNMTANGKRPMQIIAAIMRKLAVVAFAIVKDKTIFDPAKHA